MSTGPRSRAQRVADARHRLEHDVDVWVATGAGRPHLAPLSLDWDGELVLLATGESTPTARNLLSGGSARLALGTTRDVVSVEARLERHQPAEQVPAPVLERYRRRAGWLPGAGDVVLWLRPVRIQAWREVDEMPGRTLMVGGRWLD
ncbi:pyridoxamine 5'-phosphate oxidase family protein [Auraticoccus sp. F435]|uniref:Pyridoxamine 5'-phosphate oxidase family protein n=1 Tax=Auraticoccus cholistanensis TaxID=2656650 RepID=A0A6A9UPL4_9ACTN|nr:pyridoxamine 5'-phosphate oxidase family protein [Auraticoccus cholistanensis]MVA74653.1 pyridoxamine 5'-phosphate oxidase family protein [Auraticoccus cholistanensis]